MTFASWLFLDVVQALVFYWWAWGLLIVLQVVIFVALWHMGLRPWWRWAPSWLLAAGFVAAMAWPFLHR